MTERRPISDIYSLFWKLSFPTNQVLVPSLKYWPPQTLWHRYRVLATNLINKMVQCFPLSSLVRNIHLPFITRVKYFMSPANIFIYKSKNIFEKTDFVMQEMFHVGSLRWSSDSSPCKKLPKLRSTVFRTNLLHVRSHATRRGFYQGNSSYPSTCKQGEHSKPKCMFSNSNFTWTCRSFRFRFQLSHSPSCQPACPDCRRTTAKARIVTVRRVQSIRHRSGNTGQGLRCRLTS